jgi:hypothetical protein
MKRIRHGSFFAAPTKTVQTRQSIWGFLAYPRWHPACSCDRPEGVMSSELSQPDALRYLDAEHVSHPSGTFAGLTLCSTDDHKLGAISGVLVEPASRRVRYFVVERRIALLLRRYILPADTPAVLDASDRKLRVLATEEDLERFDTWIERYSEDDAITAMFAQPAA